jgi:hypothetical protein
VSDAYSVRIAGGVLRTLQVGPPRGIPLNAAWAIFEFHPRAAQPGPLESLQASARRTGGLPRRQALFRIDEEERVIRVVRVDHGPDICRPA